MPVVGLDHVQLAMPRGEEQAARQFYGDLLGLPELPKPANLAKRGGVWFAAGSHQLHLGVEEPFAPAKKAHPALVIRDLAEMRERLVQAGIATRDDEPLPGYDRFYADEPFGCRNPTQGLPFRAPPLDLPT